MNRDNELSPLGAEIVGALTEFRDALANGTPIEKQFTIRTVRLNLRPSVYGAEDVKRTRQLLNMSQALFAEYLGVSVQTIRAWEQGKKAPSPMARRFLDEIAANPDYHRSRLRKLTVKS